ncbi:hypothetical protein CAUPRSCDRAFT_12440 [Caulochytrium protostelioides]|uniref:Uncharacterized protein n=1 Tax=Caulochytrium protostelioides TaxID=1555241 RepID=A0A4P9WWT2_9FUNG|nr:hypothetical protein CAUPRSCDRAFT_12440 [Caulochytrium protostelioides]
MPWTPHRATYTTGGGIVSIGKMGNLMSVNATRVGAVCGFYLTPIKQFVLGVVSLISLMGWPAPAGSVMVNPKMMFYSQDSARRGESMAPRLRSDTQALPRDQEVLRFPYSKTNVRHESPKTIERETRNPQP